MSAHHDAEHLPEPKTPMWLPALGAALFAIGALYWTMSSSDAPAPASDGEGAPAKAAAPAKPEAAAPAAREDGPLKGGATPPPGGTPGRKLPDFVKKMRDQAQRH